MHNDHNKNSSTTVEVDVTPISFQCYDADKCPAINVLKNDLPAVKIEKLDDGSTVAKCPISAFAQAQEIVRVTCFGCRARG